MILKKECYNDERAIKKGNSLMLKKVIKEAFPTVLAFTMSGMYSIVDGIFVGKAAGDTGLAAINIAWPIPALITALGIGIGTGGSVLYSHYRGRGEQKVCENLFELTMTLLIGTGILATILLSLVQKPFLEILGAAGSVQTEAIKYTAIIIAGSILQVVGTGIMPLLRNMNQSLGAMLSMAAGFAVNILVNYYLMFRLNMGIKGAAFGTVTAQAVVVMAGCAILWKIWQDVRSCGKQVIENGDRCGTDNMLQIFSRLESRHLEHHLRRQRHLFLQICSVFVMVEMQRWRVMRLFLILYFLFSIF